MAETVAAFAAETRVDPTAIEKSLAQWWRANKDDGEDAVTRAALWNVVAHTSSSEQQAYASETLAMASAAVPQRTIIVRSDPAAPPEIASWISANCHQVGGSKQVCSEEISIIAGGDRIHRLPPLVNALLIPDMPVAFWWLGDLPNEHEEYVETLLDAADRLIVDSVHFDSPADLDLLSRVARKTTTAPADLNWMRLAEWRAATASIFDPPHMRSRLQSIRRVRVISGTADESFFGQMIEALLYAAWISAQVGHQVDEAGNVKGPAGAIDYKFERRKQTSDVGGIAFVEIGFEDGSGASIARDRDRGVLTANVDGTQTIAESVTRAKPQSIEELIVRQLKRTGRDQILVKALPIASRLARRIAR
jgi:glucose-6-phosphate dehydrogenase assembly protein OpcA